MQPRKILIAPVELVVVPSVNRNLVERSHLVSFSLVETGENGNDAPQNEEDAELHRGQILFSSNPWNQCHAQFDYRGIQGEQIRHQADFRR